MKTSLTTARFGGSRRWRRDLTTQFAATWRLLAIILGLTVATFIVVSRLHFSDRVNAYQLIDDPAPFAGLASYTGLLSYASVVVWCVAATVCAFGGWLLRGLYGTRELATFLLVFAGLNAWMALDDLLIIHEDGGEALMGFDNRHVGEALFFLVYASLTALCLWRYRALILQTEYLLLIAAAIPFAISLALDIVLQLDMGGNNIFLEAVISRSWGGPVVDIAEEVLKLTGVALWCIYLTRVAYRGVRAVMRPTAVRNPNLGGRPALAAVPAAGEQVVTPSAPAPNGQPVPAPAPAKRRRSKRR